MDKSKNSKNRKEVNLLERSGLVRRLLWVEYEERPMTRVSVTPLYELTSSLLGRAFIEAHMADAALSPPFAAYPNAFLPADALLRSTSSLPLASVTLKKLLGRLRARQPVVVTAIGQSNTVLYGGCFGEAGCGDEAKRHNWTTTRSAHGWAGEFMEWLNATWPHPDHALYNHAAGASNSKFVTTCLASHLAAGTDLLLVDFNIGGWDATTQEHFARTAALLAHPPFVLYVGLCLWCPRHHVTDSEIHKQAPEAASRSSRFTASVRLEAAHCYEDLKNRTLSESDATGDSLDVVAAHYASGYISLFRALRPLLIDANRSLAPVTDWTKDGIHANFVVFNRSSGERVALYYRALTELIVNFVRVTASEIPAEASLAAAPHEATHATRASVRSQLSVLPAPLRAGLLPPSDKLSCYSWDPLMGALPSPRVLFNAPHGGGWRYNEFTTNGTIRRKPGLVSLSPADVVDLEVTILTSGEAANGTTLGAHRAHGRSSVAACIGLSYLESYEHMGTVRATCLPPCICAARTIDALDSSAQHSVFKTVEIALTSSSHVCVLRLANEGRTGGTSEQLSKFRLNGMYVRRRDAAARAGECENAPDTPRLSELDVPGRKQDHSVGVASAAVPVPARRL